MSAAREHRILAIDPHSRGFGYAVLEGTDRLVDWGLKAARHHPNAQSLARILDLIAIYRPDTIAIEDHSAKSSRRRERVKKLLNEVAALCRENKIAVRRVSRGRVQKIFSLCGKLTDHDLAIALTTRFPELAIDLPPKRKPWMSPNPRMSIFGAVALALARANARTKARR